MSETTNSNRNSGLMSWQRIRDLSVILTMTVVAYKIATSEFSLVLSNFSFSDLLALILALFSVALSAAFYFKSAESSNRFYTNTHSFTKDVSEILGRIEAGFGERLRNLDQGYTGLTEKLDRYQQPYLAAEQAAKEEESKAELAKEEQQKLIESLAERAKLREDEKATLFDQLDTISKELQEARHQAEIYRRKLDRLQSMPPVNGSPVFRHLINQINRHIGSVWWRGNMSPEKIFQIVRPHLIDRALEDMRAEGLLSEDNSLTEAAELQLSKAKRHYRMNQDRNEL